MSNRLNPGENLTKGNSLVSPNGRYVLRMQDDGNLVLRAPGNEPIWASATDKTAADIVMMQRDGNLVIRKPVNVPIWESNTDGNSDSVLILQDDGNLVIYAHGNRPIWATGTNIEGKMTDMFLSLSNDDFARTCSECGIQIPAAAATAGDPKGRAINAAAAAIASSDCRKCVAESFRRIKETAENLADEVQKRIDRERFEEMDRINYEAEQYERYKNSGEIMA